MSVEGLFTNWTIDLSVRDIAIRSRYLAENPAPLRDPVFAQKWNRQVSKSLETFVPSQEPKLRITDDSTPNHVANTLSHLVHLEHPGNLLAEAHQLRKPIEGWLRPKNGYAPDSLRKGITNRELYDIVNNATDVTTDYPCHIYETYDLWTDNILSWYGSTRTSRPASRTSQKGSPRVRFEEPRTPSPDLSWTQDTTVLAPTPTKPGSAAVLRTPEPSAPPEQESPATKRWNALTDKQRTAIEEGYAREYGDSGGPDEYLDWADNYRDRRFKNPFEAK